MKNINTNTRMFKLQQLIVRNKLGRHDQSSHDFLDIYFFRYYLIIIYPKSRDCFGRYFRPATYLLLFFALSILIFSWSDETCESLSIYSLKLSV